MQIQNAICKLQTESGATLALLRVGARLEDAGVRLGCALPTYAREGDAWRLGASGWRGRGSMCVRGARMRIIHYAFL